MVGGAGISGTETVLSFLDSGVGAGFIGEDGVLAGEIGEGVVLWFTRIVAALGLGNGWGFFF